VSRSANNVAATLIEDDDLFQHPSSVIYLLNLFLSLLRHNCRTAPIPQALVESDHSNSSPSRQFNSKEEFKNLTKAIIHLLNKVGSNVESIGHI
jgi:hypothetical protein